MLLLHALAGSAVAMLASGGQQQAAGGHATAKATQAFGIGAAGGMTDEADVQLRAEGDPLGMPAADMLALPAITTPSLKDLETATTTASTTAAGAKSAAQRATATHVEFTDSVDDLLSYADAPKNVTPTQSPDALALSEIQATQFATAPALKDALPEWPPSDKFLVEHDDPHGPLSASAIQARAMKNKMWSHGMTQSAVKANGRHLSGDNEWATEALRTTGGIVATIDDDYPYQCHCSRKSSADMQASGALGSSTSTAPGTSLAESGALDAAESESEEKSKSPFTGVCTHHPDEECMAIPGDHAAVLSVLALALL